MRILRRSLYLLMLALGLLLLSFFAFLPGDSGGAFGEESNLLQPLQERIALLERALEYRLAGEAEEGRGNLPGALGAYRRSYALYEDFALREKIRSLEESLGPLMGRTPPDLEPLRQRIAYLEGLLTGAPPQEDLVDLVTLPELPQEDLLWEEDSDWRNYPDLPEEKAAIEESLQEFRSALQEKDIPRAVSHIDAGCREEYAALFAHNPEAMPSFAEILEKAEMSFLAAADRTDPSTSTSLRTSEYAVELDGFTFYLRWIKVEGQWVLFDF